VIKALGELPLSPVHVRNFYREKLDEGLSSATA
jgi:hypothetical protein